MKFPSLVRLDMEIKKGKYRHFKGNVYELVAIARHSETLEDMVVYRSPRDGGVWVRPLSMWSEKVAFNGETVERFSYIGE